MFKTIPIIVMAVLCLNFNSRAQSPKPLPIPNKQAILGKVLSATTGEALPGAVIKIMTSNHTTISNDKGEFILTLSNGTYNISISHLSYKTKKISIQIPLKDRLIVALETDIAETKGEQLIQVNNIKPLKIGDTIPEAIWSMPLQVVNHPESKKTITLNDYRGKLIILDFLHSGCSGCIQALPKINLLQSQFGKDMRVLPISYESRARALLAFQKNKILNDFKSNYIVEDSTLKCYFPHQYISHIVWINPKGVVCATTRSNYITKENIDLLLNNKPIHWAVKRDVPNFDYNKHLLTLNKGTLPEFSIPKSQYHSMLTGNMGNINTRNFEYTDTAANVYRVYIINRPIVELYLRTLLGNRNDFPISHVMSIAVDRNRIFFYPNMEYKQNWDIKNTYTYEGIFPTSSTKEQRVNKIKSDLDFYLGLKGDFEDVNVKCLVITKSNQNIIQATTKSKRTLSSVIYSLNRTIPSCPVFNETGNDDIVTLIENEDMNDLSLVKTKLKNQGLSIIEEKRTVRMFVIRGSENQSSNKLFTSENY